MILIAEYNYLFRKTNEEIEGNENLKFAHVDMNGNLKFILNKLFNTKYVFIIYFHIILRNFDVLPNFPFTKSEMKHNY